MAAPNLTFTISRTKISTVSGYDHVDVSFLSDVAYQAFECRATRVGDPYGLGVGRLIASFSTTPADTTRTFEVYDYDLVNGEGDYRISLYAQGENGQWNDYCGFIPSGSTGLQVPGDRFVLWLGVLSEVEINLEEATLDISDVSYIEVSDCCLKSQSAYLKFYCRREVANA